MKICLESLMKRSCDNLDVEHWVKILNNIVLNSLLIELCFENKWRKCLNINMEIRAEIKH